MQTGAAPAEIAARLRVAAPVLLPGLGAAPHWQVVVARVDWAGGEIEGGPVAQALLEEILVDPLLTGPEHSDRIAVAHTGDEAIALVPLPAVSSEHDGSEAGILAEELLTAVRDPLSAGLDDDGRLTIGVSAAVHSAEGLRGALEEARHARRVAGGAPRPGVRGGPPRTGLARTAAARSSRTTSAAPSRPASWTRCGTTTGGTGPS